MREAIRFHGSVQTVSVSRKADRWFISFGVKVDDHTPYFKQHAKNQGEVVGLDAGLTSHVTDNFKTIVVENLNVKGMMKNKHLALAFSDASLSEMKRQLIYKAKLRGGEVIEAPRFFASSKLCSCCGWKNKGLKLSDRSWTCSVCGAEHDRDINAAVNLRQYAVSYTVKASGETSSGETVRNGRKTTRNVAKLASVKGETALSNLS